MFQLDKTLQHDTFPLTDLPLCKVLLMNNRLYHWLILVPRKESAVEIIDLEEYERAMLMKEITIASRVLKNVFNAYKINVAALGNQVRQLHVHIIARQRDDAAWPYPVWGGKSEIYKPQEREKIESLIKNGFEKIKA